jgi:hypothetical protein
LLKCSKYFIICSFRNLNEEHSHMIKSKWIVIIIFKEDSHISDSHYDTQWIQPYYDQCTLHIVTCSSATGSWNCTRPALSYVTHLRSSISILHRAALSLPSRSSLSLCNHNVKMYHSIKMFTMWGRQKAAKIIK